MKFIFNSGLLLLTLISAGSLAQDISTQKQKVVITGVRFAYPLLQKWIDDYSTVNPTVQILIESRGAADPKQYDILIEAYEQPEEIKNSREYVNIARYAIVIVANSNSKFANTYSNKGLTQELIKQLFFHDLYGDKENELIIKYPYTIYTRLQKAGAPFVFSKHFGYQQIDINGKSIAGADEHLLKALLRDSTGVSYLPLPLAYNHVIKKAVDGLTVLPVDLNGNGRISEDEKFYDDLLKVTQRLEAASPKDIHNIPIEYLHFSVDKYTASAEAVEFLRWVIQNGQDDLESFGYLKPEPHRFEKDKFEQFASKRRHLK